jgi:hypothetical protein
MYKTVSLNQRLPCLGKHFLRLKRAVHFLTGQALGPFRFASQMMRRKRRGIYPVFRRRSSEMKANFHFAPR